MVGEAEVDELDGCSAVFEGDEEIGRLDVAVEDAFLVGMGERRGGFEKPLDAGVAVRWAGFPPEVFEAAALAELHHIVRVLLGALAEVEDASDLRMGERGGGAGLGKEGFAVLPLLLLAADE